MHCHYADPFETLEFGVRFAERSKIDGGVQQVPPAKKGAAPNKTGAPGKTGTPSKTSAPDTSATPTLDPPARTGKTGKSTPTRFDKAAPPADDKLSMKDAVQKSASPAQSDADKAQLKAHRTQVLAAAKKANLLPDKHVTFDSKGRAKYTVQPGDSYWAIAGRSSGKADGSPDLAHWAKTTRTNSERMGRDPQVGLIHPGEKVTIVDRDLRSLAQALGIPRPVPGGGTLPVPGQVEQHDGHEHGHDHSHGEDSVLQEMPTQGRPPRNGPPTTDGSLPTQGRPPAPGDVPGQFTPPTPPGSEQPVVPVAPEQQPAPKPEPEPEPAAPKGEAPKNADLVAPIEGGKISTHFGVKGEMWSSGYHTGADFQAPVGTPIKAVAAGKVEKDSWGGAYGNQVIIDHGNGRYSMYAHLDEASPLSPGDEVEAGEKIGEVGVTGNTSGPHLHLEVYKGKAPVYGNGINPAPFISGEEGF